MPFVFGGYHFNGGTAQRITQYLKHEIELRVDKIYTLSQSIVISKFGAVKKYIIDAVREKLYELI